MKSIKLSLAVLMLAAAFTACTKEEFAPTQDIQQDEFVGAKLIGSDLSVNFVRDGETKVDAYGNWEKGDEAGLGWVINGNVGEIDGIKYKIAGAVKNKMDVILVSPYNYEEAKKVIKENNYDIELVKVSTFKEAIHYLTK